MTRVGEFRGDELGASEVGECAALVETELQRAGVEIASMEATLVRQRLGRMLLVLRSTVASWPSTPPTLEQVAFIWSQVAELTADARAIRNTES
jgi:hypothetical protein